MHAKLAVAPIAWSNDDLPELGGETSLETCLKESRLAGFVGVETGGKFPRDPEALIKALAAHDLQLASGWYSGTLLDNDLETEKAQISEQIALFKAAGAACIAYGETAGSIQTKRGIPLSERRRLTESEIIDYAKRITLLAEHCAESGMPISFHHHMGTAIESEQDLDLLMRHSAPPLGLLFDAGHMAFAGGDVMRVIEKHGARITHVHTKDIRRAVTDGLDRTKASFLDAVLKGAFTVPGDGSLDFEAIIAKIAASGFEGWFVVEAEQDPEKANPFEYAKIGYKALRAAVENAGYQLS